MEGHDVGIDGELGEGQKLTEIFFSSDPDYLQAERPANMQQASCSNALPKSQNPFLLFSEILRFFTIFCVFWYNNSLRES